MMNLSLEIIAMTCLSGMTCLGDFPANAQAVSSDSAGLVFTCSEPTGLFNKEASITSEVGQTLTNSYTLNFEGPDSTFYSISAQRPSLNARIENDNNSIVQEYIDFNPLGLDVIPVDSPIRLEIDLKGESSVLTYTNESKIFQLNCKVSADELLNFLKIKLIDISAMHDVKAVAFDVDDTLLYTTPSFTRGFATGGLPKPEDKIFWTQVNACDAGCPEATIVGADGTTKILAPNPASPIKIKARELIEFHQAMGHRIYAITARPDINGDALRVYLETHFGIQKENVFFEPEIDLPGNQAGKTDRIEKLNLDVFYGDSDSDITDTRKAFMDAAGIRSKNVQAIRFLRSPKSSNRKAGRLNKYHPGYYDESIIAGSYE